MDPSCAKDISDHVNSKFGWKQDKLVLSLGPDGDEQVRFDVVPYLGTEAKQVLTLPNSTIAQKEMIALFKEQASKQGVHLTTVASSSNSESSKGCFFKLACNRFRAHNLGNDHDGTSQQSTTPSPLQLYNPNVKTGALRSSKTTRGLAGKKMARRSETTKSRSKRQCCTFNFTFKLNHHTACWELNGGTGSSQHQFHPKAILGLSPTLRETPQEIKDQALEFFEATNSPATASTIIRFRTGLELTSSQLNYLKRKQDNSEGIELKSSADDLLAYLRGRKDVSYMCLYDTMQTDLLAGRNKGRPSKQQKIVEMRAVEGGAEVSSDLPDNPPEAVYMDAKEVREALLVDDSENILLAIAWVTNEGVRLFRLFPEVTFWDTQQKTNRERRPCFLGCGKDSENRCFTYLWAFMPSECRWVFDWLYSKAMPTLLGRTYLQKTILSLTDGDTNEYGPLQEGIKEGTFAMSEHGLCGFHLVDRSQVNNPYGQPAAKKKKKFALVKDELKKWIYSWMRDVETTAEYEVSKALLLEWSVSTQVVLAIGTTISENLRRWIIKKILPHVPKTLLVHRLKRRTFGEYVNSVAEIEGALMKRGNDVMPYMALATSAKNMTEKQERRIIRKSVRDVTKVTSAPTWSKSLTSTKVTVHAEGVIQGQFLLGMCQGRYSCARTNETTWLVRGETNTAYLGASCVPTFIRTRMITLIDGKLLCSCGFFERIGLCCRHLYVVLRRGPLPNDCITRWRRDYLAFCRRGDAKLDEHFDKAERMEVIGPVYVEDEALPQEYPVFVTGERKDIKYFLGPIQAELPDFYSDAKGLLDVAALKHYQAADVYVHTGLEGEVQLSQTLLSQDIMGSEDNSPAITNTDVQKAFSLLNPIFKSIVAVTKDSTTLTLAYEGLRKIRRDCLKAQDDMNEDSATSTGTNVRFRSSNLDLDKYAKSNKRIKPMGEGK
jgi:hypothetical protein